MATDTQFQRHKRTMSAREQQAFTRGFWNGFIVGSAIQGIQFWKLLFARFPIPGLSDIIMNMPPKEKT